MPPRKRPRGAHNETSTDQSSPEPARKRAKEAKPKAKRTAAASSDVSTTATSAAFDNEKELEKAFSHLKKSDKALAALISGDYPKPNFFNDTNMYPFASLCKSIIFQQVSGYSGKAIWTRFCNLFAKYGKRDDLPISKITPERVQRTSIDDLRGVGLSARKAEYVTGLASFAKNGVLVESKLKVMSTDEIISLLTSVKGIGVWTVHMLLIFCLRRCDILPVGDLAVRKGFQKHFHLPEPPSPSQMESLAEKWSPYRSVGTWYMWRLAGTGRK